MRALGNGIDPGGGRRVAWEVIGDGEPWPYFEGGPGFSAALLRGDAEQLADRFAVHPIDPPGSGGSTPPSDPALYDHIGHACFSTTSGRRWASRPRDHAHLIRWDRRVDLRITVPGGHNALYIGGIVRGRR
jgi:pimeloyl-ACP methyl ester carboxylesterase